VSPKVESLLPEPVLDTNTIYWRGLKLELQDGIFKAEVGRTSVVAKVGDFDQSAINASKSGSRWHASIGSGYGVGYATASEALDAALKLTYKIVSDRRDAADKALIALQPLIDYVDTLDALGLPPHVLATLLVLASGDRSRIKVMRTDIFDTSRTLTVRIEQTVHIEHVSDLSVEAKVSWWADSSSP